jgi:head-tail adaptor
MLTDGALEFYRETLGLTYPDTCTIERVQGSADGMGGFTYGTTVAGTYACRIAPQGMPPFEVLVAGQMQAVSTHVITFEALTDIRPTDRIKSGTRVFNVTGGTGDRSWELSKRVLANEVNEAAG